MKAIAARMKTLIRSTAEVRALQAGASLVVIPKTLPGDFIRAVSYEEYFEKVLKSAPYAVGDVVGVKETFSVEWKIDPDDKSVAYRADDLMWDADYRWKSPVTMPINLARTHLEITSVRCGLVSGTTEAEYWDCGFSDRGGTGPYLSPFGGRRIVNNFAAEWNARYGKKYPWATSWAWFFGVQVKA